MRLTYLLGYLTVYAVSAAFTANSAMAADKVTIMVGGYEKQIYLPAKLAEAVGLLQG